MGARMARPWTRLKCPPKVSLPALLLFGERPMLENRQNTCCTLLVRPLRWMQGRSMSGEAVPERLPHPSQP
jgi:hypothetical protein